MDSSQLEMSEHDSSQIEMSQSGLISDLSTPLSSAWIYALACASGGALVAHARAYLGDGNKHWCCWWQHEDATFV